MPISFGVPLGILIFLVGAGIWLLTQQRRVALALIGLGVGITIVTLLLIFLAVNSSM